MVGVLAFPIGDIEPVWCTRPSRTLSLGQTPNRGFPRAVFSCPPELIANETQDRT